MRVPNHEERDRLLDINDVLLDSLRQMNDEGMDMEDMIGLLRRSSVPKPAASIALIRAGVVHGLRTARTAVDQSRAYARWPDQDEAYAPVASTSQPPIERSEAAA